MTILSASSARVVPWKNGLGTTLEIVTDAATEGGPWSWRLSIADVPRPALFSVFEGVDRAIACVEGEGMRLLREGVWEDVPREGDGLAFAGEARIEGEPLGPGVRDANLMVRRDRWRARMTLLRAGAFTLDAPVVLVHALRATPEIDCDERSGRLSEGDTLVTTGRVAIDAHGACVIACALWPTA